MKSLNEILWNDEDFITQGITGKDGKITIEYSKEQPYCGGCGGCMGSGMSECTGIPFR